MPPQRFLEQIVPTVFNAAQVSASGRQAAARAYQHGVGHNSKSNSQLSKYQHSELGSRQGLEQGRTAASGGRLGLS